MWKTHLPALVRSPDPKPIILLCSRRKYWVLIGGERIYPRVSPWVWISIPDQRGEMIQFLIKKIKKIFILFYSRYNMPCATSFLKLIGTESSSLAANSILTWRGSISDHRGVSSRARLLHCTLIWLTPAITANVGNSTVQFLVVGVCVRAHPLLYPMKKQSTEKGVAAMICFGHHPSLPRGLANLLCIIPFFFMGNRLAIFIIAHARTQTHMHAHTSTIY